MEKEKELLLKDLSARLLYGIICKCTYPVNNETTYGEDVLFTDDYEIEDVRRVGAGFAGDKRWYKITFGGETYDINDDGIKVIPYLRPMSSMTKEEKEEYINIKQGECNGCVLTGKGDPNTEFLLVDFFNAHHFDYRGLIEKGLAIEAPEGMYE